MKAFGAWVLACGSGMACAQAAVEVNPNAQFDADIAGVALREAPSGGSIAWSPEDLTGRAGSGSLRIMGPAGVYVLHACVHPEPAVAYAYQPFRYELSARARALGTPAVVTAEVVLMFGGDDPETDGPCNRPTTGYLGTQSVVVSDATLAASKVENAAWPDASLSITVRKSVGDFELDAWSLKLEELPLLADDFE